MTKDFLTLLDFSGAELEGFLKDAYRLKQERQKGIVHDHYLKGKSIAMIFEKSSTRTRVSFEVGIKELGGHPMFLSTNDIQLGRGESIKDTARVLSRYVHGIMIRTFGQERIEELAKYASVPVINGLSNEYHPCQIMADVLTCYESFNSLKFSVAYIGDGNNMAHSWLNGAARLGFDINIASPKGYEPDAAIVAKAQAAAKESGAKINIVNDPKEAVKGVNVVTTDVWASMGQEQEAQERMKAFAGVYQVNDELMSLAAPDAIFLHCLPAHIDEEVTESVFESPASKVFDEAENRLHVQKAIMMNLIK